MVYAPGSPARCRLRRRGLQQPRREVARLGQQEQADLRDVRAGRDVDQVVLAIRIERVAAREVVQRAVDLAEVPRVAELDACGAHDRLRRQRPDVVGHGRRERLLRAAVQQLEAADDEVVVPAQVHRRPPGSQRSGPRPRSSIDPEKPDDDGLLYH